MDNAFLVRGFEAFGDLDRGRERLGELEGAFADLLAQRPAFQEGHDDERPPVGLVDLVNGADVGMVERGGGLGFALEALAAFVVAEQVRREEFEGDGPVEFRVCGFVHHAHPAFTELVGDAVVRDRGADQGGGHRKLCVIVAQSSLVLG